MYIKSRIPATIYRVILVVSGIYGVYLNLSAGSTSPLELLSYFTIQSNILVIAFFAALVVQTLATGALRASNPREPWPSLKGAVTLAVTITFLVFHFMLRPTMFSMTEYTSSLANILPHYVVPLMSLGDWLLFTPKGLWKRLDPVKWLLIPLAYLAFALIRAQFAVFASGSHYPYFFIDVDRFGPEQVLLNSVIIGLGFAALGYAMFGVDRLLAWMAQRLKHSRDGQ
ncbi:MAG: Pr6Pr family membrane protein [Coriobacteriales bacterium]|jgi:hypothetical protein|nr:Pr6Pr family membrane protein [Coriobacteriales bacterium]